MEYFFSNYGLEIVVGMIISVLVFIFLRVLYFGYLKKDMKHWLMFEWIGGLFGLGQDGGFFIFLFIVLCFVGYLVWKFDIGDVDGP